jgi:hypothetical protein
MIRYQRQRILLLLQNNRKRRSIFNGHPAILALSHSNISTACSIISSRCPLRQFSSAQSNENDNTTSLSSLSSSNLFEQASSSLPKGAQIHLDFFGEPVTFLGAHDNKDKISLAVA